MQKSSDEHTGAAVQHEVRSRHHLRNKARCGFVKDRPSPEIWHLPKGRLQTSSVAARNALTRARELAVRSGTRTGVLKLLQAEG